VEDLGSLLVVAFMYPKMKSTLPPPPPPPRALLDPPKFIAPAFHITMSPPGVSHAPEPSSIIIGALGAGLTGLYAVRKRKRINPVSAARSVFA
jgi:LPXTG-motif cell wall-anchored protein